MAQDNTTTTAHNETPQTEQQTEVKLGEFGGKYKYVCEELFKFLTDNYGLTPSKSHRIAHAYACDYGAAIKKLGASTIKDKASATSKQGYITLRETISTVAKKVESTPALQLGHAVQWLSDAGKHGVSYGNTDWQFAESIQTWIDGLAE